MTSPDTADLAGKGGLILDAQGASRCFWQPSMPDYHDHESVSYTHLTLPTKA